MAMEPEISQNQYQYQPLTRQTKFGTIDQPMALCLLRRSEKINMTYFWQ
jgi:hypothetical protein